MKERQVEKLTPDMVGMEVYNGIGEWWEIIFVDYPISVCRESNGFAGAIQTSGRWTIRDPKEKEKLPSERLGEKETGSFHYNCVLWSILDEHHKRLLELEARP